MKTKPSFKMKLLQVAGIAVAVLGLAGIASADTVDFVAMGDADEHGASSLEINGTDFVLTITAFDSSGDSNAYLAAGFGGLGVCDTDCGSANNAKAASGEGLVLTFDVDVIISNILMNNNNGTGDGSLKFDKMSIGGALYQFTDGGVGQNSSAPGPYAVAAGESFVISNPNGWSDGKMFYVSQITVDLDPESEPQVPQEQEPPTKVPEPISLTLIGIGLLGVGAATRRRAS